MQTILQVDRDRAKVQARDNWLVLFLIAILCCLYGRKHLFRKRQRKDYIDATCIVQISTFSNTFYPFTFDGQCAYCTATLCMDGLPTCCCSGRCRGKV